MTLFLPKTECILFEMHVTQKGETMDWVFSREEQLFETLNGGMSWCENARMKSLSMSCSDKTTLVIHGTISTNENGVSKVVQLLSGHAFKQSLIDCLSIPQSTKIDVSFSMDRERKGDENSKRDSHVISGKSAKESGSTADSGIELTNGSNSVGKRVSSDKSSSMQEDWKDEIESLMHEWRVCVNGGNGYIDVMIDYAMKLIDSLQSRKALLHSLIIDSGDLIEATIQFTLNNEKKFEKSIKLLNRLISYCGDTIFPIFESNHLDELLIRGVTKHDENETIVKKCFNIVDIMMNESRQVWQKMVNDEYNICEILARLAECSEMELKTRDDFMVAIINLIHGVFGKSRSLNCNDIKVIFNHFIKHYLDHLVMIVEKIGASKVSVPFCVLLRFVLRTPKANMIKFENDLLFQKSYDIFQILLNILVFEIEENDFYAIDQVLQVLIILLSNTGNEDVLKSKLCKQQYFLNFEGLLIYYIKKWEIYYNMGNDDFDNMIGYIIQFMYLFFSNNNNNDNVVSLQYLDEMVPLASMRINDASKIYIWKFNFVGSSDSSRVFAVNSHRTRKNILFPGISNGNINNHVKDSNEAFRKRNKLYDVFGKYFCDTQYIYAFSNNDCNEYDLGYSFNEYVNIKLVNVGFIKVNDKIEALFDYCFNYGNNIDIDGVNYISSDFLQAGEYFRQAIKHEEPLLDGLINNNFLCWAQACRLYDDFDSPACRAVKNNNDLRMHVFTFLKGIDIIQLNKTGKQWYRITSPLITWNDKNHEWFIDLWGRGSGRKWLNNDSSERIMNGYNRIVENRIKRNVNFVKKWFYQCSNLVIVKFLHLKLDLLDESRRDGGYNYIRNINDKCDIIINEYQTYLDLKDYKIIYYGKEFVVRTFSNMFDLVYTFVDSDDLKLLKKLTFDVSTDIGMINSEIRSLNELNKNDIWDRNDTLQCFACHVIRLLLRACLRVLKEVIMRIEDTVNVKNLKKVEKFLKKVKK